MKEALNGGSGAVDHSIAQRGTRLLGHVCGALIATMAVLMSIQVIGRFVFQHPPEWTEELARVAFVYATFLGGALAVSRGAHLGIDILADALPPRASAILELAWRLLAAVVLVLIIWHGYRLVDRLSTQPLSSVPLSKGWMFAGVPIGCALMLVYEVQRIRIVIRSLRQGRDLPGPGTRVATLSDQDPDRSA